MLVQNKTRVMERINGRLSNIQFCVCAISDSPSILLRSALCRSGFSSASRLRSTLAHTMNAFIGRRTRCSRAFFSLAAACLLLMALLAGAPPPLPAAAALAIIIPDDWFQHISWPTIVVA